MLSVSSSDNEVGMETRFLTSQTGEEPSYLSNYFIFAKVELEIGKSTWHFRVTIVASN